MGRTRSSRPPTSWAWWLRGGHRPVRLADVTHLAQEWRICTIRRQQSGFPSRPQTIREGKPDRAEQPQTQAGPPLKPWQARGGPAESP